MLFDNVVNVTTGPVEETIMTTGKHDVRQLYCVKCQAKVGWTYEKWYAEEQKYKEGKFILEEAFLELVNYPSAHEEIGGDSSFSEDTD